MGLAPAGVHAQQHRGPVECFGAARPGVDVHDSPQFVLVAAQHVAHLQLFDRFACLGILLVHLLLGEDPLFQKVGHQLQILDAAAHLVVIVDPRLDARHLAQLFAGLVGIFPKIGLLGLLFLVAQVDALLLDLQALFEPFAAGFQLLDLFGKYHGVNEC